MSPELPSQTSSPPPDRGTLLEARDDETSRRTSPESPRPTRTASECSPDSQPVTGNEAYGGRASAMLWAEMEAAALRASRARTMERGWWWATEKEEEGGTVEEGGTDDQTGGGDVEDGGLPVFSADDDVSHRVLFPGMNHALALLDKTLAILGGDGESCASDDDASSCSETASEEEITSSSEEEETSSSEEEETSPPIKTKTSPSEEEKTSPPPIPTTTSPDSDNDQEPPVSQPPPSSSSDSEDESIGPDWKDVLQAAACAGFDHNVIVRAAQRCSNLFNEGILLRRFQAPTQESSITILPNTSAAHPSSSSSSTTSSPPQRRHSSQTQGARSRSRSASAGSSARVFYCPVERCARAKNGFGKNWLLQRHMRHVHPGWKDEDVVMDEDVVVDEDSVKDKRVKKRPREDECEGGLHVDGFLRVIVPREGWSQEDGEEDSL
ncbi:hypothetical protein CDD80_310 [Ophiocordyceps camponoti-rufipedis]|uniref:Rrn9 domain-containing protein n=1 Tax=Ophiocordyceps camponoti-rufipedis TaxID=2004952 RepID=A0A2C5YL55_9HYPO|nr:hypothetical protein CDD80_310 [Ophiocordyceps camponoti-rufipedis]